MQMNVIAQKPMSVVISTLKSREALGKGWNLQPSFQRRTKPSKALATALESSAKQNALVFPVMIRENEVGDGRKRMLVLQQWAEYEKNPPTGTFSSYWKRLLDGTLVVALDYEMPLSDFLVEFENHNQVNERMANGELLNAQFHGFPEEVKKLIIDNGRLRSHRRMQELTFLGYLLTGLEFNARTNDVLKKMAEVKDSITPGKVTEKIGVLIELGELCEQMEFAIRNTKDVRRPASKSDQATLLRLIQNYDTSSLHAEFDTLRDGWVRFVESTKGQSQRESKGDDYRTLAECFGVLSAKKKPAAGIKAEGEKAKKA